MCHWECWNFVYIASCWQGLKLCATESVEAAGDCILWWQGVKQQVDTAINKATSYLTSQLTTIQSDPYALAVTTYALYLAGSPNADTALAMLDKLAIIQGVHWLTG